MEVLTQLQSLCVWLHHCWLSWCGRHMPSLEHIIEWCTHVTAECAGEECEVVHDFKT